MPLSPMSHKSVSVVPQKEVMIERIIAALRYLGREAENVDFKVGADRLNQLSAELLTLYVAEKFAAFDGEDPDAARGPKTR